MRAKPNRLIHAHSPYLLKHAYNPVDWREWGEEAIQAAKREGKLIFLSIGYTACHWCNELEKECFERPDFAKVINPRFICIKLDREERPDLDMVYMNAALALQGHGGWPNNVFLTPDLEPLFALGYQRRETFKSVLAQIHDYWINNRSRALEDGKRIRHALARHLEGGTANPGAPAPMDLSGLRENMDMVYGGFGDGAKFPMTAILEFLLTGGNDDPFLIRTLDAMSRGGMCDHVGGGFHRYTTDREWSIPHFEKMLYDNALLASLFARASHLLRRPDYAHTARRTLDFIYRELRNGDGGYLSSLDADSEGAEGRYYLWSLDDFAKVAGREEAQALGVTAGGNMYDIMVENGAPVRRLTGESVIRLMDDADHSSVLARLMAARETRPRPALDDKVVAAWHSMAVSAFARGGALLDDAGQIDRAEEGARFLLGKMKLAHMWRGSPIGEADLDDAAFSAMAFWDLFEATGKGEYLAAAREYADYAHANFSAGDGGYYVTKAKPDLIARPRARDDNPLPNAGAVLGLVEFRLSVAYGEEYRRERAGKTAVHLMNSLGGAGFHSGQAMTLKAEVEAGPTEIVFAFSLRERDRAAWIREGYARIPGLVRIPLGAAELSPGLSEGRVQVENTKAFVCRGKSCAAAAGTLDALREILRVHP